MDVLKPQCYKNIKHRPNSPRKNECSDRIRQLALPNLHLVLAVIKDHFQTLKHQRVERLEKLAKEIEETKQDLESIRKSKQDVKVLIDDTWQYKGGEKSEDKEKMEESDYIYDNTVSDCVSIEGSASSKCHLDKESTTIDDACNEEIEEERNLTVEEIYNCSNDPDLQDSSQSETTEHTEVSKEDDKDGETLGSTVNPTNHLVLSDPEIPTTEATEYTSRKYNSEPNSIQDYFFDITEEQKLLAMSGKPIKSVVTAEQIKRFTPAMHEPLGTFFTLTRSGGKLALIKICMLRSRNRFI